MSHTAPEAAGPDTSGLDRMIGSGPLVTVSDRVGDGVSLCLSDVVSE